MLLGSKDPQSEILALGRGLFSPLQKARLLRRCRKQNGTRGSVKSALYVLN
jgi:hypothetical protein